MSRFKLLYFVIFIISHHIINAQISDKRLCVDKECKVPTSKAKTLLRYSSPDSRILSFNSNEDVTIYSKSAGSREDLWGAEIRGKRGYIPKHMVREIKVLQKPSLLVDTETTSKKVPSVVPDKVQDAYEVVDGTTIYLNPQEIIKPTSTKDPVEPTALPSSQEGEETKSNEPAETVTESEKPTEVISDKDGSIIKNVLSTFSGFMGNNDQIEDVDDEDDEEEDEEDDEDDGDIEDEGETEESNETASEKPKVEAFTGPLDESVPRDIISGLSVEQQPQKVDINQPQIPVEPVLKPGSPPPVNPGLISNDPVEFKQVLDSKVAAEIPPASINVINPDIGKVDSIVDPANAYVNPATGSPSVSFDPVNPTVVTVSPPADSSNPSIDSLNPSITAGTPTTSANAAVNPVTPSVVSASLPVVVVNSISDSVNSVEPASPSNSGGSVDPAGSISPVASSDESISPSINSDVNPAGSLDPATPSNIISNPSVNSESPSIVSAGPPVEITNLVDSTATLNSPPSEPVNVVNPSASSPLVSSDLKNVLVETTPTESPLLVSSSSNLEDSVTPSTISPAVTDAPSVIKSEEVQIQQHQETPQSLIQSEYTTISPEYEIPQPVYESVLEVTPNPVSQVSSEVPSPFGLFDQASSEDKPSEEIKDEISATDLDSGEIREDASNETDFSFSESVGDLMNASEEATNDEDQSSHKEINESTNEGGLFYGIVSMFGSSDQDVKIEDIVPEAALPSEKQQIVEEIVSEAALPPEKQHIDDVVSTHDSEEETCDASPCDEFKKEAEKSLPLPLPPPSPASVKMDYFTTFNSNIFIYLMTTAVSVIIFLFGYIAFDKNNRKGPLVAKINSLEKQLAIVIKENQILQEKITCDSSNNFVSNELVENLKQELAEQELVKSALEEQIQSLEKELENSTEVGMELNRMLSEILSSESGSDVLKANVEHLQRQLVEQQGTINSITETLAITNTENHELRLELEISSRKVLDLQAELDKVVLNVLKIEEEKDTQQTTLENEIQTYKRKFEETLNKLKIKETESAEETKSLRIHSSQLERDLQLKINEFNILTEALKQLKEVKNVDTLLDASSVRAELQLLKSENQNYVLKLQQEHDAKVLFEKRAQTAVDEATKLRGKYEEADKSKMETETKLEVLSNYFKEREAQLQKEISKHESIWAEKQGEATSTNERIKFMQEQLQNYKAQNESLKQEIVAQEVDLKSQISVLEKKAHENWVSARQAERKLEEAKQEAAQLRHRLTLRERAIQEEKGQLNRLQSPIEQNGDHPISPIESPASPPLLYGTRDHITKSPPIPGLPPFLPPPPPGVHFMPPPPIPGVPPFIPPPPSMYPGDHRPPPLGRMSSPPINSRYSPSSRDYSFYDSSPSDSEYGNSPPHRRGYSPYNNRDDRRDYKRPPPARNLKSSPSSGSANSNESLEKIHRQKSKV